MIKDQTEQELEELIKILRSNEFKDIPLRKNLNFDETKTCEWEVL